MMEWLLIIFINSQSVDAGEVFTYERFNTREECVKVAQISKSLVPHKSMFSNKVAYECTTITTLKDK